MNELSDALVFFGASVRGDYNHSASFQALRTE